MLYLFQYTDGRECLKDFKTDLEAVNQAVMEEAHCTRECDRTRLYSPGEPWRTLYEMGASDDPTKGLFKVRAMVKFKSWDKPSVLNCRYFWTAEDAERYVERELDMLQE